MFKIANRLEQSFILKLMLMVTIVATGATLVNIEPWFSHFLGTILIGVMFAHALELQHQCLHYQGFESKALNRFIGFVLGLPMLVSFSHYRFKHLHHHRHLGRKTDLEFFTYNSSGNIKLGSFLWDLSGLSQLRSAVINILTAFGFLEQCDEHLTAEARFEYILITLVLGAALAVNPIATFQFWIAPLLFIAGPAHFLIEIPEHLFCERGSTDVYRNTRSIRGSSFSRWLTNANNFHVEHHRKPSLPFAKLRSEYEQTPAKMHRHQEDSYFCFYAKVVRALKVARAPAPILEVTP